MDARDLDLSAVIGHLKSQFSSARPVLFTGAGFSSYCQNLQKQSLPLGRQLREDIWKICFPDKPFDEATTLQDIYAVARLRHPNDLHQLLLTRFTVDAGSIPDWMRNTFCLPWHRIYTLNIDDAPIALQRRYKLPRAIKAISANSGSIRSLKDSADDREIECVCLNGHLPDGVDKLTFSAIQFGEKLGRDEPWYMQLVDDLMYRPVIFVGTNLDEPPLWQYLTKRLGRLNGDEEYRPKSYLVSPSLSPARAVALREHNITHVPLEAEGFFRTLIEKSEAEVSIGRSYLESLSAKKSTAPVLGRVEIAGSNSGLPSMFLFGAEPTWEDLLANRAIIRECDKALKAQMEKLSNQKEKKRLLLVHGTAGTGKSTSLRRLALATAVNHPSAWVEQIDHIPPRTIIEGMNSPSSPHYLFIDDADSYGSELSPLLHSVLTSSNNPLIVLSCPSSRIDRVINPALLSNVLIEEVAIPNLCDSDIDSLLTVLERENSLGVLTSRTQVERKKIFQERCGRQLIVAMIEATSGKRFEDKIWDEFSELEPQAKAIYAAVSLASSLHFELTREQLLMSLDKKDNSTINSLQRLIQRKLIFQIRSGHLIARHRVIADGVISRLSATAGLQKLLYDVTWAIAATIDPLSHTKTPSHRLLIRLLNHDYLKQILGGAATSSHYGQLEKILAGDYNYWLQRGSHELQEDRLEMAERFLNNARGRNERDLNTQTEYAYLHFKKALANPNLPSSQKFVEDAVTLLKENIWKRGHKDAHAYHVLGYNSLQWARRGSLAKSQRIEFLELSKSAVLDGCKLHPRNTHLAKLRQQLDIELRIL